MGYPNSPMPLKTRIFGVEEVKKPCSPDFELEVSV